MIGKKWSSICIQPLLFNSNKNNVYSHFFRACGICRTVMSQKIKTQSKVTLEILSLKRQHCISVQPRVSNPW